MKGRLVNATLLPASNSYCGIEPQRCVAAAIMAQFPPFADRRTLAPYGAFERAVYKASGTG
jgi:hypothetical protein